MAQAVAPILDSTNSDVRDVCSNVGYWSISGLVMRTLSSEADWATNG